MPAVPVPGSPVTGLELTPRRLRRGRRSSVPEVADVNQRRSPCRSESARENIAARGHDAAIRPVSAVAPNSKPCHHAAGLALSRSCSEVVGKGEHQDRGAGVEQLLEHDGLRGWPSRYGVGPILPILLPPRRARGDSRFAAHEADY